VARSGDRWSVAQEAANGHVGEEFARHAAEDPLPNAAVTVAPSHDQVGPFAVYELEHLSGDGRIRSTMEIGNS
jgi:hypothetical protein